jgi:hypothetical protein
MNAVYALKLNELGNDLSLNRFSKDLSITFAGGKYQAIVWAKNSTSLQQSSISIKGRKYHCYGKPYSSGGSRRV